ncbi:MAG TPA: hypothetical protein VEH04_01540 [Verrucomicrobiae bacterium]|nr:hypothetical protein [Verrucomicrobiae bacterium]
MTPNTRNTDIRRRELQLEVAELDSNTAATVMHPNAVNPAGHVKAELTSEKVAAVGKPPL